MEMIAHCVAMLVLALVQKCHDACIIDLCTSKLFLCPFVFPRWHTRIHVLAGVFFFPLLGGLAFSDH